MARGSTFTPENMDISNIEVGLLSKVLINKKDNLKIGKFIVDYSRAQLGDMPIPIVFDKVIPDLTNTHLEMKTVSADASLQAEERFKIAEFTTNSETDTENAKKQCEELIKKYDSDGKTGFKKDSLKCETIDSNKCELYATKQVGNNNDDDGGKDGLSAGAIAGIVIACVVVVAAIIALLVYFLVIKKKNQSTTSTQGDSSIAI